jgi:hypothetical protein
LLRADNTRCIGYVFASALCASLEYRYNPALTQNGTDNAGMHSFSDNKQEVTGEGYQPQC